VAHQRLAERLRQMTRAAEMTPVPRHLTAEAPPSREVSTTDSELRVMEGMSEHKARSARCGHVITSMLLWPGW
jgi:hypothetical protein